MGKRVGGGRVWLRGDEAEAHGGDALDSGTDGREGDCICRGGRELVLLGPMA